MNTQTTTKNVEQKEKIYMCVCNELPFIKNKCINLIYSGAKNGHSFDLISNP